MVTAGVAAEDADAADSGAGLRLVLGKDGQPPAAASAAYGPTGDVEYEGSSDDDDAPSDDDAAAEAATAPTGAVAAAEAPPPLPARSRRRPCPDRARPRCAGGRAGIDGASGGCVRGCWHHQPGRYHRARASSSRIIAEARQRGCRQRCSR